MEDAFSVPFILSWYLMFHRKQAIFAGNLLEVWNTARMLKSVQHCTKRKIELFSFVKQNSNVAKHNRRYTHWKPVAIFHTQMSCSQSADRSLSRFLIRQQLCVNIAYAHSIKYSICSASYFVSLMNVPSLSINQDYSGMRDLTLHSSISISFIIIR